MAAYPISLWLLVLPITTAVLYRKPRNVALLIGLFMLASHLGQIAEAGLSEPDRVTYEGEATLVGDPSWFGASLRVDVRIGQTRLEAWASGDSARALSHLLMGEKVWLRGRVGPLPPQVTWLRTRHIAGRLTVFEVSATGPANPAFRAANWLRRILERGSSSLAGQGYERQALFLGLVIGDDRNQSIAMADAFSGSGLTHLLAVSGSNVAFVVSLASPFLKRMRKGLRWFTTLMLLTFFVIVTRFEPSVLRAGVMAGVATTGATLGFRTQTKTVLALSVAVLICIDPFLVHSLAFRLSVAASMGILWASERLTQVLAVFRVLAHPLAVTISAQLAVAPILIPTFGSMPLAALPANLLAAPVAGPVMMWGLGAGLPAGLLPPRLAEILHIPTRLMVWWIDEVARRSAYLPMGSVRSVHLIIIIMALLMYKSIRYLDAGAVYMRMVVVALLTLVLTHPVIESVRQPPMLMDRDQAVQIYRRGAATVVVLGNVNNAAAILEQLREAHVRHIDVLATQHGGRSNAVVVAAIIDVYAPELILAPKNHRIPGASVLAPGSWIGVGDFMVYMSELPTAPLRVLVM